MDYYGTKFGKFSVECALKWAIMGIKLLKLFILKH